MDKKKWEGHYALSREHGGFVTDRSKLQHCSMKGQLGI